MILTPAGRVSKTSLETRERENYSSDRFLCAASWCAKLRWQQDHNQINNECAVFMLLIVFWKNLSPF
jgi:hypothetical protein